MLTGNPLAIDNFMNMKIVLPSHCLVRNFLSFSSSYVLLKYICYLKTAYILNNLRLKTVQYIKNFCTNVTSYPMLRKSTVKLELEAFLKKLEERLCCSRDISTVMSYLLSSEYNHSFFCGFFFSLPASLRGALVASLHGFSMKLVENGESTAKMKSNIFFNQTCELRAPPT